MCNQAGNEMVVYRPDGTVWLDVRFENEAKTQLKATGLFGAREVATGKGRV